METSVNVNKHWKTVAKGNEVLTNVISANQHFTSTFLMQIFKLQGWTSSCKLSFLFPPRQQSSPESLLAGYILIHDCIKVTQKYSSTAVLKVTQSFQFTIQNPSSVTFPQFKCTEQFCSLIKTRLQITVNVTDEGIWMGSKRSEHLSRKCCCGRIFLSNLSFVLSCIKRCDTLC